MASPVLPSKPDSGLPPFMGITEEERTSLVWEQRSSHVWFAYTYDLRTKKRVIRYRISYSTTPGELKSKPWINQSTVIGSIVSGKSVEIISYEKKPCGCLETIDSYIEGANKKKTISVDQCMEHHVETSLSKQQQYY